MERLKTVILSVAAACLLSAISVIAQNDNRTFPAGFIFGTATASYQVEGAWDTDGKTENIWDYMTHNNPTSIRDLSNGDIAANSYHLYQRDVEMLRELGVDFYRFSLSWPRILPTGFPDVINVAGVTYYNNLIDELLRYNITPVVTLYHWDLPQRLQELGGWTSPHIVDQFGDFARVAYTMFGDRVKNWITINEPKQVCYYGYGLTLHAPQVGMSGIADYLCARYTLLAHARAWHIYDDEFRATQGGLNGITVHTEWYEPATDSPDDIQAALDVTAFEYGMYTHPIFTQEGDWPIELKTNVAARSAAQGYPRSRLPPFTQEEIAYMIGTSDFFGANSYNPFIISRVPSTSEEASYQDDMGAIMTSWPSGTERDNFWGYYRMFLHIRDTYNNPPVFIIENGVGTDPTREDDVRVNHYRRALTAVLDALDEGCNITGYTAWSLMDNFEWSFGYLWRFGVYEVDFEDPARPRTPKTSAFVYKEIVRTRTIDLDYTPAPDAVMTIDPGN